MFRTSRAAFFALALMAGSASVNPGATAGQQISVEKDKVVLTGLASGLPMAYSRNSGKWIGLETGIYFDQAADKVYGVAHGTGGSAYADFTKCNVAIDEHLKATAGRIFPEIKREDIKPGTRLEMLFNRDVEFGYSTAAALVRLNNLRGSVPTAPMKDLLTMYFSTEEGQKLHVLWSFNDFHAYSRAEMESKATQVPRNELRDYAPELKALLVKDKKTVVDPLK